MQELARIVGMEPTNLYRIFKSNRDVKASTLHAFSSAVEAQWVLVPKYLLPEVERLIEGKAVGLDDVPSSLELFLGDKQ